MQIYTSFAITATTTVMQRSKTTTRKNRWQENLSWSFNNSVHFTWKCKVLPFKVGSFTWTLCQADFSRVVPAVVTNSECFASFVDNFHSQKTAVSVITLLVLIRRRPRLVICSLAWPSWKSPQIQFKKKKPYTNTWWWVTTSGNPRIMLNPQDRNS